VLLEQLLCFFTVLFRQRVVFIIVCYDVALQVGAFSVTSLKSELERANKEWALAKEDLGELIVWLSACFTVGTCVCVVCAHLHLCVPNLISSVALRQPTLLSPKWKSRF
jgi:hypothetical protein